MMVKKSLLMARSGFLVLPVLRVQRVSTGTAFIELQGRLGWIRERIIPRIIPWIQ